MLVENKDYMFIPHPSDDQHYAVKILKGPYEGVTYYYTKFKGITEDNERLQAIVSFEYNVIEDLGLITNQKDFQNAIGDILTAHITQINQSENPQEQMQFDDEEPRNDHTSEFDSE